MHTRIIGLFVFLLTATFLHADRLVLVSASYGKNILAITEANGDVIWSHKTAGQAKGHAGHHDVHMLSNGKKGAITDRLQRLYKVEVNNLYPKK